MPDKKTSEGSVEDLLAPPPLPATASDDLSDLWNRLCDSAADPLERSEALVELLRHSAATDANDNLARWAAVAIGSSVLSTVSPVVGSFVAVSASVMAAQYDQARLPAARWDALVFAAEGVHFPANRWAEVSNYLLTIATRLRFREDGPEKVVWSALRRGASLLDPGQIGRLLPFLLPDGAVDTRAVALQCVERLFEPAPPATPPVEVADRVALFAEKFLDPDVFTAGEPSLIARNAVAALAAIGDSRLRDAVVRIVALNRPWLTRRVRDELTHLSQEWRVRGVPRDHAAVANLDHATALLG
jgi:hypothetical protein